MKIQYPVYFEKNICIHCGHNGSLLFIDKMGNETKQPIYPIINMVCKDCGTEYFLEWIRNDNDKMIPICIDKDKIKNFESEISKFALENKRKPI